MGNCGTGIGPISFGGNCNWIIIAVVVLFFCGGFGGLGGGCGGGIFGGSNIIWILAIALFLLPNLGLGSIFGGGPR